MAGLLHGTLRGDHHLQINNKMQRAVTLYEAGVAPEETLHKMRVPKLIGRREGHLTLPGTLNVTRKRDGAQNQDDAGTEDGGENAVTMPEQRSIDVLH